MSAYKGIIAHTNWGENKKVVREEKILFLFGTGLVEPEPTRLPLETLYR